MCHNQTNEPQPVAQPVVVSVPQPDDGIEVIQVGAAPYVRLSLLATLYSPISTP
jgi:hypothetical protein